MSTHTPGPWIYPGKHNYIENTQGEQVLDTGCGCCSCHSTTNEDWTLMAAAPELLEALKVARKEAIAWCNDSVGFNPDVDEHPDWLVVIDAAITKATGETK